VEQELPNIRAEVPSPSSDSTTADPALTIILLKATRVTLATVQGAVRPLPFRLTVLIFVPQQDLLFKQFQKSPENPYGYAFYSYNLCRLSLTLILYRFNQVTVEYNATTEDKVDALRQRQDEIRDRLREKS